MTSPRVSILTPTYNHRRFIAACVESVLAQGFEDWEQIVVDDGSTDETAEIVRSYTDARIRLLTESHRGLDRLADIYNQALSTSRGELIAILEGDDYWPIDKLATQVPAFDDPSVVMAFGITEVVTSTASRLPGRIPPRRAARVLRPDVLRNSPPGRALVGFLDPRCLMFTYPCTVLIRRSALEAIGGFLQSPRMPVVDYPTFLHLSLEGTFHYTPRVMGYWRLHPAGTTVNRLESILRGADDEAADFAERHRSEMRMSDDERETLRHSWRAARAMLATYDGRRQLVRRRWVEARAPFAAAWRDGRPVHRLIGALGMLASRLGQPIELVYRLTGRPWFRLGAAGDIEVVV